MPNPTDHAAWTLFERLAVLAAAEQRQAAAEHGLQEIHLSILRYLAEANRYSDTLSALVDFLGSTKGTVSQSVTLLTKRGLIERVADPVDRRKQHLTVTADGGALLAAIANHQSLPAALQASAADAKRLASLMEAWLRRAQRANGTKPFGMCGDCRHHRVADDGSRQCGLTNEPLTQAEAALRCREFASP